MKKITLSQLLILLGFLVLTNQVKAQSDAILVPTYQNRSEMPAKLKPEQKMLRQLPKVVIYENAVDIALFKSEMNEWVTKNPVMLSQLEKSVAELINKKQFDDLAQILIEMNHTKEIALIKAEGGKHE